MRFAIATLGCKVNQHESDTLTAALEVCGWQAVTKGQTADVCVVNTCTVTQRASMQSRQLIRQLQRAHPGARMVVTGCYAQIAPGEITAIQGVHTIVPQSRKGDLPQMIVAAVESLANATDASLAKALSEESWAETTLTASGKRTRPFLKIQDGCNSFCTYCIVPHARGRSRSMTPERVLTHLAHLGHMGYREVVLTGIHLGAYGLDLQPSTHLSALMEAIDAKRPADRVRLSSIEPNELTDAMIDQVAASDAFCPHFHLPLQSGDDTILKRMGRLYTRDDFRRRVAATKQRLPHAAIGADVLVGFPGESDVAFANTVALIAQLPLSYLHVFPFSARPGTPAAKFPDQVPSDVVKARTAEIRALGAAKKKAFMRQAVGRQFAVLIEQRRDPLSGHLKGLTGNYLSVLVEGDDAHMNTIVPVKLVDLHDSDQMAGHIAASPLNVNPISK
jgi:threonylcarbamoyladenosine tRNA methylthiotransferase MtaB